MEPQTVVVIIGVLFIAGALWWARPTKQDRERQYKVTSLAKKESWEDLSEDEIPD